jgi:hypothetical protein
MPSTIIAMLNFVIPLKSRAVSVNWELAQHLCERTVRSILRQTSDQFRLFLVCTDRPDIDLSHPAISVIQDDFPIPDEKPQSRMHDKGLKGRRGLVEVGRFGDGHVMMVDADDCINRKVVEWVVSHDPEQSWVIERGYCYSEGHRLVRLIPRFDQLCGTSIIARLQTRDFPIDMLAPRGSYFDYLIDGHPNAAEYLRNHGRPVSKLPFPGAVYVKDTGENWSGRKPAGLRYMGVRTHVQRLSQIRPFTPSIKNDFGIYPIQLAVGRQEAPVRV